MKERVTHQTDEQKEYQKRASENRLTVDVAVAHRGHGHDEKVNTRPVRESIGVAEFQRVSRVLQLCNCNNVCVTKFICVEPDSITRWMMPAAVSQTDMKIETSCAKRMELDVFSIFRY